MGDPPYTILRLEMADPWRSLAVPHSMVVKDAEPGDSPSSICFEEGDHPPSPAHIWTRELRGGSPITDYVEEDSPPTELGFWDPNDRRRPRGTSRERSD